jgi:hypothetical protein
MYKSIYSFIFMLFLIPLILSAQFISIKSLPVVTGDQFLLYPSQNISMGNVNIALDDSWLDPFLNPAKGSRISATNLFVQPTFYVISGNLGGGRTFPVTLFLKKGEWFSTLSASFQQLEAANLSNPNWFTSQLDGPLKSYDPNRFASLTLGRKLPFDGFSVGGSFSWADLNAIGGVDLLYNGSNKIDQNGKSYELRGGLFYEDGLSTIELVGLYNNYEMTHKVEYIDVFWNSTTNRWDETKRIEKNLDYTDTYGAQIKYKEKLAEDAPYIGVLATYNWKTHPKIPNYEIMNIPRDPGNTWAYNFGIGIGLANEKTRFGLDFIFEPIWSNTWATAEEDIIFREGGGILAGQKTIENNFVFNNWIARIGLNKIYKSYDYSVGLEINSRRYSLDQYDYVQQSSRSQEENWTEYIWSWGVGLHFSRFNLKYSGRVLTGAGIPSLSQQRFWLEGAFRASGDFIVAPSGSLTTDYQTVFTHQFIIQVPLGGE